MKTVLITGCSSGIGYETALALGRKGHRVFATMRDLSKSESLGEIAQAENLSLVFTQLDVDDEASVKSAVDQALASGTIDVLINNAGIAPLGHVEETGIGEFKQVMETNFFGAIRCIQTVLPHMRKNQNGTIINITSVSGRMASSPYGAYTASKHALEAASECLAQELRPHNIRVINVEPGFTDTPILDKQGKPPEDSIYPQWKRLYGLVQAVRQNPVPASGVAEKIVEIIEGDSWQFRYPVGPDAAPFLGWRAAMTDEDWVEFGGLKEDEDWYKRVEQDFGINARN